MTPRPLTDSERAELRELLAKATPPPWGGVEDECGGKEEYYGHWHLIGPLSLMGRELHDDSRALLALRNHAEALLDAADELARLKAGVADRDHTTHYNDCGCRSARYEAEIARLKAKLAAVEPVARAALAVKEVFPRGGTTGDWVPVHLRTLDALLHAIAAMPADLRAELAKEE